MVQGIRKEKNLPERIARSLIQNEELFIQSLKIFANTSIVGSQGVQSGGSTGGPSGVGNYLRKDGDIMDGVFATRPSVATIANNEIDIRKVTETNYTSKVFLVPETGNADTLDFILGGSGSTTITGSQFPGQWLIVQPIALATITINNDVSGFGDPTATPKQNIRTPDGNPVILKNEQAVLLNFDVTSNQWSFIGAVGTSITGDSCFPPNELDDVSGAQTIFFNRNRFVRMRVIGNTTIDFDTSEMIHGCWYMVTLEILQDPGGGNSVTFDDAPFENQITPTVYTAGNRYTTIRFYAYIIESGGTIARIFAFEELQSFPTQFFDGFIQARLDTDQTSNLTPNKHLEFDLKLATDNTIVVTTGGGQGSGTFSKFEVGHLYQCECHYAIEGVISSSELTVQFFNVTKGVFFGSQGRAKLTTHTLLESSQPVAKGFFVADSIGDQIEVRIRAASGIDKIIAGSGSGESTSYVVIKDCGVAGIDSLEGNLVDASPPTSPDLFGPVEGHTGTWQSNGTNNFDLFFLVGHDSSFGETANSFPMMSSGKISKLFVRVIIDGGGRADFWIRKNFVDDPIGLFFTTPDVGLHETDDGAIEVTYVKDDLISFRWRRNDDNGTFQIVPFAEFINNEADGVQHWYSSFERKGSLSLGFWVPRVGGLVNVAGNNEDNHQSRMIERGNIRDMVYFGTSPAGSDNTPEMSLRNGGFPVAIRTLATGGGSFIQRFTNVDIDFSADDLVGCSGRSATNSENLEGRMGYKVEF